MYSGQVNIAATQRVFSYVICEAATWRQRNDAVHRTTIKLTIVTAWQSHCRNNGDGDSSNYRLKTRTKMEPTRPKWIKTAKSWLTVQANTHGWSLLVHLPIHTNQATASNDINHAWCLELEGRCTCVSCHVGWCAGVSLCLRLVGSPDWRLIHIQGLFKTHVLGARRNGGLKALQVMA